jgi:ureidoglycolate lyase
MRDMKLCRFGAPGEERPGIVDVAGRIRDLSGVVADIDASALSASGLAQLRAVDVEALPFAPEGARYSEPVVFNKWVNCLQGANDPVVIPRGSIKTDWEVELGVVIGSRAYTVSESDALTHVAGYCVVNDVSERQWQLERGPTWDKGKGFPTFGPVGPWLVTTDEVSDPQALGLWLEVNGKRVQHGTTATMIFSVAEIVAYCSQFMELEPGDIITTGTPPGVGLGQKPVPWYLKAGDSIRLGIDGLGEQRQDCVAADR